MKANERSDMSSPLTAELRSLGTATGSQEEQGMAIMCDDERSSNGLVVSHQQHDVPIQTTTPCKEGHWTPEEKILFLKGLRKFGKGKWKKIGTLLPTRSILQVKSHGQKVLAKLQAGEDIFQTLHHAEASGMIPASPHRRQHSAMCSLCYSSQANSFEFQDYDDNHSMRSCASDPLPRRQRDLPQPLPTLAAHAASYDNNDMSGVARGQFEEEGFVHETGFMQHHQLAFSEVATTYPKQAHRRDQSPTAINMMDTSRDDVETDVALVLCQLARSSPSVSSFRDLPN